MGTREELCIGRACSGRGIQRATYMYIRMYCVYTHLLSQARIQLSHGSCLQVEPRYYIDCLTEVNLDWLRLAFCQVRVYVHDGSCLLSWLCTCTRKSMQ